MLPARSIPALWRSTIVWAGIAAMRTGLLPYPTLWMQWIEVDGPFNIPLRFEHQGNNASGDARDLALVAVENTMVVVLVSNGTVEEALNEFVAGLLPILDHQGLCFLGGDVQALLY